MTKFSIVGFIAGSVVMSMLLVAGQSVAQTTSHSSETPTFSKDVAPILQRSCQRCHRPNSLAPMSLISYEEVRPWARSIKNRTSLRDRPGVMPPWYIEKNIGMIIVWLIGGGTMHQFTVMVLLMSIVGFYLL